jgi:hypothetical protein
LLPLADRSTTSANEPFIKELTKNLKGEIKLLLPLADRSTTSARQFPPEADQPLAEKIRKACPELVSGSKLKKKSFNLYPKIKKTTSQYHLFYLLV